MRYLIYHDGLIVLTLCGFSLTLNEMNIYLLMFVVYALNFHLEYCFTVNYIILWLLSKVQVKFLIHMVTLVLNF